jgi:glyoxylase-like metal-dependent hydrolase (beta-lactamase superfamily II)
MRAVRLEEAPCDHHVKISSSPVTRVPGLRDVVATQAIPTDYFERVIALGTQVDRIGDSPIYAFRRGFTRSLVIDTPEGLAVFDSFDAAHATALRRWLERTFPARPVRWLVYSHYHLDHTRGGDVLEPVEVIAHAGCVGYLDDLGPAATAGLVAPISTTIDGDTTLRFGGVEVHAYDTGHSHTDCLYAFHLPAQRTLFTADLGFVRMLPPFGFPDWYYPGYMRALARVAELDFEQFVPTHGDLGEHRDLVDFTTMMRDVRDSVDAAFDRHGGPEVASDGHTCRIILREEIGGLRQRYGSWHGFDSMMLPLFFRQLGGVFLGY